MQDNAGGKKEDNKCQDRQQTLVDYLEALMKIALDNNDLRHNVARHAAQLTEHGEKILKLEGEGFIISQSVNKFISHMEQSAIKPEDQKQIAEFLSAYKKSKEKGATILKYYVIGSVPILIAVVLGIPVGATVKAFLKALFSMLL